MEEKGLTWLEAFYDLIYAAAISETMSLLIYEEEGLIPLENLLKFVLIFIPIWWAWVGQSLFINRFGKDSVSQRLFMIIQMAFVILMTASLSVHFDRYYAPFLIGYLGIRLLVAVQHLWVKKRNNIKDTDAAKYLGYGFLVGIVVSLASIFFDFWMRYFVLYLGIFIDMLIPVFGRKFLFKTPIDTSHLLERFGLFTIILFGESIISIIADLHLEKGEWTAIAFALVSFVIIISLWWQYFDNLEQKIDKNMQSTGQSIIYGHLFIYMSLSIIASAIQLVFLHDIRYWFVVLLVFLATGIYFLSTTLVFQKYKFKEHRLNKNHLSIFLGILAIFITLDILMMVPEIIIFIQAAIFFAIYAWATTRSKQQT